MRKKLENSVNLFYREIKKNPPKTTYPHLSTVLIPKIHNPKIKIVVTKGGNEVGETIEDGISSFSCKENEAFSCKENKALLRVGVK